MAFDKFSLCPCGSGKKAKFCCSKDLVHEFEAIDRMIAGDQRIAAVEHINRLLQSHPDLPSLLAIKAEASLHLNDWENVEDAARRLLEKGADTSRPYALLAIAAAAQERVEQAVELLQDATDRLRDNTIDSFTLQAFAMVGSALQQIGALVAARGHLVFYTVIASRNSERASLPLTRFDSSTRIPLLVKDQIIVGEPPENAPWRSAYDEATRLVGQGRMRACANALTKLVEKYPKEPAILVNLATQLGWINRGTESAEVWRRFSLLDNIDHETAVEAEALAQVADDQPISDVVSSVMITYTLDAVDPVMERLLSDAHVVRAPVDPQELVDEGEPPPRAAFLLLDRVPSKEEGDLRRENLPRIVGELLVFGKQTDRPARLELIAAHTTDVDRESSRLIEIVGSLTESDRQVMDASSTWLSTQMFPRWYLPENVSQQQSLQMMAEQARQAMIELWPKQPTAILDGKSPNEAAADFHLRQRVEALILRLESDDLPNLADFDFNQLRRKLDLPTRDAIDPAQADVREMPLVRLARLEPDKLNDEQLLIAFQRAQTCAAVRALRQLASEVIRRDSLAEKIDRNNIYRLLVQLATSSDRALELVHEAQQYAKSKGQSPAQWLLVELNLRMQRGDVNELQKIMQTLQSRHLNEPGVAEALYQFLYSIGAISQDGQPMPEMSAAGSQPAAAPAPSGIWTPGSPTTAPSGQGKSKLWVPGMD